MKDKITARGSNRSSKDLQLLSAEASEALSLSSLFLLPLSSLLLLESWKNTTSGVVLQTHTGLRQKGEQSLPAMLRFFSVADFFRDSI
jgi:hypothetical protein